MPHDKKFNPDWHVAETYFDADLHGVAQTSDGPYAVGASGVIVTETEYGWVPVVEAGPASKNSTLKTVAATDGGARIWFAGASGALGMYDVEAKQLYNYSYTGDVTDSWQSIAVTGKAGKEKVLVANGSGAVLPFTVDKTDVSWGEPTKPGGGSTISTLGVTPKGVAYAADTSGNVYRATDEKSWEKIGIPDAQVGFNDIYAGKKGRVFVAADSGLLYRFDDTKDKWTPIEVAETPLRAVDAHPESGHVTVLADDNTFYWRTLGGEARWQKQEAPIGKDLLDIAMGYPDVAVGKAGAVIVRPPAEKPKKEKKKKQKGKHKHEEPKPEPHPDPCPIILEELLTRIESEKLLELLKAKGCYTGIVETLTEQRTEKKEIIKLLEEADIVSLLAERLVAREGEDIFREQDVVEDVAEAEAEPEARLREQLCGKETAETAETLDLEALLRERGGEVETTETADIETVLLERLGETETKTKTEEADVDVLRRLLEN
ncbi:WD40/YVTN/BNR-like repeat-containing protein [Halospeciosus flavus]|uniref:WD40/YVTN/BNR-like repeat-containing protein n=1 Tax=Halospeciosus flavus TaxID=3032283 RepID=A0ABD5Z1V0_9EURY|nr:hypothetical protein [Halospeciosus flavus]